MPKRFFLGAIFITTILILGLFFIEVSKISATFVDTKIEDFAGTSQFLAHQIRICYAVLYDIITFTPAVKHGSGVDISKYRNWITTERQLEDELKKRGLSKKLKIVVFDNKKVVRGPYNFSYLNYNSLKAHNFLENNKLEQVISGAKTEMEVMIKLLHWTHTRWADHYSHTVGNYDSSLIVAYKNRSFSAFDILRYDAPVNKIDCVASSYLFTQALGSLGYEARIITVADHVACEAWSDEYEKWIFMDPYYDVYFLKGEMPLNWFELHQLLIGINKLWGGTSITSFKDVVSFYQKYGVEIKSLSFDGRNYDGPADNNMFHFLSNHIFGPVFAVNLRNDHIENIYPKWHARYHKYGKMNVLWKQKGVNYNYARINETWQSPNLDYNSPVVPLKFRLPLSWQATENIDDLYWTLNLTQIHVNPNIIIEGREGKIEVFLGTFTPNFSSFYFSINNDEWKSCSSNFTWRLVPGENFMKVRVRDKYGHFGPVSKIGLRLAE